MSTVTSLFQQHLDKVAARPSKVQSIIIVDCHYDMTNLYGEWKELFDGLSFGAFRDIEYHLYMFHMTCEDGYMWTCLHNGQKDFDIQEKVKDCGTVGLMDYIREEIIRGNLNTGKNACRPIVTVNYRNLEDTKDCAVRQCLVRWDEHRRPSRCYRLACMDYQPEPVKDFNNVSTFGDVVPNLTGSTRYGCGVGICQIGTADTPLAHTVEYGEDRLSKSIQVILNAAANKGSYAKDDDPDILF